MQDIRKPFTRSRSSSNDLQSRVEQFEAARYRNDDYDEEPVQIPVKKLRRDVRDMDMYPKRKSDIYEEVYDEEYDERDRVPPSRITRNSRYVGKKSSLGTLIFIIATILLVTGVTLYTFVFDSATITIVPKYKDVTITQQPIPFSKDGTDAKGVPFIISSASLSKSKTLALSESRKVEAKASGKATIYNNYDSNPQKLIKNTRFESTKGKIYRINQSVEVPGKKGSTPGSIEVTLYADSTGPDYNTSAMTFSIPGFKGTPRESAFYAKTSNPIAGGSSGNMSLASLSDLNAAKDSLAIELGKEIQTELFKIRKEGYVPLYTATEIIYDDNQEEILKGTTGVYKITATGNLMLANGPQLAETLAKTLGDYDNAPVRLINADKLKFTRKESDIVTGTTTFSVVAEGKPTVIWESDAASIKEMLLGKKRDEFKALMKTVNSIESAEVSFSPLWLSHFPEELSKLIVNEVLPKR